VTITFRKSNKNSQERRTSAYQPCRQKHPAFRSSLVSSASLVFPYLLYLCCKSRYHIYRSSLIKGEMLNFLFPVIISQRGDMFRLSFVRLQFVRLREHSLFSITKTNEIHVRRLSYNFLFLYNFIQNRNVLTNVVNKQSMTFHKHTS
jgi:hypothetical protein